MFGLDDAADEDPSPRVAVAVGARVTLELERIGCDDEDRSGPDDLHACLPDDLRTIEDVRLSASGVFETGNVGADGFADREIFVELTALAPGETRLVLDYTDRRGEVRQQTYLLEAAQITRVEHTVECGGPAAGSSRLPVSIGAEFLWSARAFADLTPLATGSMPLVEDYGGFETPEPPDEDGQGWARAPMSSGTYAWTLAGADSEPLQWVVYDPAEVGLSLSANEGQDGVVLQPAVDGQPVCIFDGEARAQVEVVNGDCDLVVGAFEIEGALPVGVRESALTLGLSGRDTCRVQATLGGAIVDETMAVDNMPAGPDVASGETIGQTPREIWPSEAGHETCKEVRGLAKGGCEVVDDEGNFDIDGDCLLSAHWDLRHVDGTSRHTQVPGSVVGVGLRSELQARVRYDLLGITIGHYNPNDLGASAQSGLTLDYPGCEGSWGGVVLTPSAAGDYSVTLDAKNAEGPKGRSIQAREVARTTFTTDAIEQITEGSTTTAYYFVGSTVSVALGYEASDGAVLGGVAPWVGTASGGAMPAARYDRLETGAQPGAVRLESSVTADDYVVEVVDAASIAGVRGFDDTEVAGLTCIEVHATTEQDVAIHGEAPVRPRLAFSGGDVLTVRTAAPGVGQAKLCVEGNAPGEATLELRWGVVDEMRTFTVQ